MHRLTFMAFAEAVSHIPEGEHRMIGHFIRAVVALAVVIQVTLFSLCYGATQGFERSMDTLARAVTENMSRSGKQFVAVLDFSDLNGRISELGSFVAEELLGRIHRLQKVKIVERRLVYRIVEEHGFGMSGVVDEKSVKRLGSMIGADTICTGTISDLRTVIKINARMLDVERGLVFAAATAELDKTEALRALMRKNVQSRNAHIKNRVSVSQDGNVDLIVNGGFTDRLAGWERSIGDIRQGASKTEIVDFQQGRSGRVLHIRHEGNGHVQFSQMVSVPTIDLKFTATFQADTHEGMVMAFSGTGVAQIGLQYFGRNRERLGQSVLLNYVKNPFADTPLIGVPRRAGDSYKTHYIEFEKGKLYRGYKLDLRREVEDNLMGVDPDTIEEIGVALWCGANGVSAGADLWVTDLELTLR